MWPMQGYAMVHSPAKLTWKLKKAPWKKRNIYKPSIFGFHVSFGSCFGYYFGHCRKKLIGHGKCHSDRDPEGIEESLVVTCSPTQWSTMFATFSGLIRR